MLKFKAQIRLSSASIRQGKLRALCRQRTLTITFYYDADNQGEADPDQGDGIADKYQILVTYKAVNGQITANPARMS